ncbi:hypothetical protein ENH_00029970 [Eimeria necatrix]|uniref:Uncharacterized protein n=1 Tax=Eimeria necatrix TaxID=51315 RepID=U6MSS0_9EIME|nr:hypothetical protein ENH_00029970 [Eimeria necatrix]CDJ67046.1 hypothetical protein ENH_00029970 [Eimeria necatrix]
MIEAPEQQDGSKGSEGDSGTGRRALPVEAAAANVGSSAAIGGMVRDNSIMEPYIIGAFGVELSNRARYSLWQQKSKKPG